MRFRVRRGVALAALPLLIAACSSCADAPGSSPSSTSSGASAPTQTPCPPASGAPERRTTFAAPPPVCIDRAKTYTAQVTTDVGEVTIALDAANAPISVNNFVVLARYRYYEGVPFHRVIPGFVIQGGDPLGTGLGGPGYQIEDEPPVAPYTTGSVAMAKTAQPNSGGSQFFIVTGPRGESLPRDYSLFGKVTAGMDVVRAIEADGGADGTPAKTHTMTSVKIVEK